MATTVDHLATDRPIRVLVAFTDADGRRFPVDYRGVIREIALDWTTFDIRMVVEREGGSRDTMRFAHGATDGPRNGRMRDYFEAGDRIPTPPPRPREEPPRAGDGVSASIPPVVGDQPITDPSREEEAITRVWALAARHRFDEAREQLLIVNRWPDPGGDRSRALAAPIGAAALAHAWDDDEAVYRWLKECSINLWYQWGAQATSGGEGSARAVEIRAAEAQWSRLEERRAPARGRDDERT